MGGMEDEEWARRQREWEELRAEEDARRQREWDAWRAEEEARRQREWDAWEAEQEAERRIEANRRERTNIMRGYWEVTEPLTSEEENELR